MADKTDNMMQEYLMLQGKIDKYRNIEYTLLTLMITITGTFLGLWLKNQKNTEILIIPFLIMFAIAPNILYLKINEIKIKTYIITFIECNLESIKYETNSEKACPFIEKIASVLKNFLLPILMLVTGMLYRYDSIKNLNDLNTNILMLVLLCFVIIENIYITYFEISDKNWGKFKNKFYKGNPNTESKFSKKKTYKSEITTQYFPNDSDDKSS